VQPGGRLIPRLKAGLTLSMLEIFENSERKEPSCTKRRHDENIFED
jgi:hypothetical protein